MRASLLTLVWLCAAASALEALQVAPDVYDSVAVSGNQRVPTDTLVSLLGIPLGETVSFTDIQRAIDRLYATREFDGIRLDQFVVDGKRVLSIEVRERPMLGHWSVRGVERMNAREVRGRVQLLEGRPYDRAAAVRSRESIRTVYEEGGYQQARVELEERPRDDGSISVVFNIHEGMRLVLSRITVDGNAALGDEEITDHMRTKPEGFWWWRDGAYNGDEIQRDIREYLPSLYASRGFIDFQVVRDTVVFDITTDKAELQLAVAEGTQYVVGDFAIVGNRQFSIDELATFFPFARSASAFPALREVNNASVPFDEVAWLDATRRVQELYANNGYLRARVMPIVERRLAENGAHVADLRWEIVEGAPAIVNKVVIRGNTKTHEDVVRRAISVVPGDVFRQDAIVQSYQRIANLGFFDQPIPVPQTIPANAHGDVDVVFTVHERPTGNVTVGAAAGQGAGISGIVGYEEPNLFGRGKRAAFQWQFGAAVNNLSLSFTDPAILGSQFSGSISLHDSRTDYVIGSLGAVRTRGGTIQLGMPLFGSPNSRLSASYTLEQAQYDTPSIAPTSGCSNCVLSRIGLTWLRDTRINLPFPTSGSMHQVTFSQTGGPFGGSGNFRRLTAEGRWYVPLGYLGQNLALGDLGKAVVLGLKARSGFLWGDIGPHFQELYSMGGTRFGVPLRGYDEFSITPNGFDPTSSTTTPDIDAFGRSYVALTAELGLRVSPALYVNAFADAGNVWGTAGEFNPTRLFRSVGVGVSALTPLGIVGLDFAYGFDRIDLSGNRAPAFRLHLRFGNVF